MNCLKCGNRTESNLCEHCGFDLQKDSFLSLIEESLERIEVPIESVANTEQSNENNETQKCEHKLNNRTNYASSYGTYKKPHKYYGNPFDEAFENESDELRKKNKKRVKFGSVSFAVVLIIGVVVLVLFCVGIIYVSSNISVGDTIYFGKYEQDGDLENGAEPVAWKVKSINYFDGTASLEAAECLDVCTYSNDNDNSWQNSKLNDWLNSDFCNTAFTEDEQKLLIRNNDTLDKIVVTSQEELEEGTLFPDISKFADDKWKQISKYNAFLWTRTQTSNGGITAYQIDDSNTGVFVTIENVNENGLVCPVIKIDMLSYCLWYKDNHSYGGWGDNSNGRRDYTIDEINNDALGDAITFNSISDGKIGHEFNFVGARKTGTTGKWNANVINVADGGTYVIRLYVHNNSPRGYDAVAEGVRVSFSLPNSNSVSNKHNIFGYLDSSNATPSRYWDGVTLIGEKDFIIEYIKGSALLENTGVGSNDGIALSDNILTDEGVLIGYSSLDGKIPGCYEYDSVITIEIKTHMVSE